MNDITEKYVEVTLRFDTVVDDLSEAWAFIMSRIERVGPDPEVHILPVKDGPPPMLQMVVKGSVEDIPRKFHVVVCGDMKEPRTDVQEED